MPGPWLKIAGGGLSLPRSLPAHMRDSPSRVRSHPRRGVPLHVLTDLPRVAEEAHHGRQDQLRREGDGEDDDHPPPDEFGPHPEGDVERAEEGDDARRGQRGRRRYEEYG